MTNFRYFQTEKLADDNFKFWCIGIENTVGNGEIARMSNFSFPTLFSNDFYGRHVKKKGLVLKGQLAFPSFPPEFFRVV